MISINYHSVYTTLLNYELYPLLFFVFSSLFSIWQNMLLACYQVDVYLVGPIILWPIYGVKIDCKGIIEYYKHLFSYFVSFIYK